MWLSIANYEYQTIDLTPLATWPMLLAFLTHITVLFELFYCALIWNRLTRPVILLTAVLMHLGIATCLGMATFGLAHADWKRRFYTSQYPTRAAFAPSTGCITTEQEVTDASMSPACLSCLSAR